MLARSCVSFWGCRGAGGGGGVGMAMHLRISRIENQLGVENQEVTCLQTPGLGRLSLTTPAAFARQHRDALRRLPRARQGRAPRQC